MAAAAWSWVEKMLHEAQRTSAPSASSVSIRTAVWMVMCSEPAMRAPFSGCSRRRHTPRGSHQARHFGLGDGDFLAAKISQKVDPALVAGLALPLRPPAQVRRAYIRRHRALMRAAAEETAARPGPARR
jgi:hypothetical protein